MKKKHKMPAQEKVGTFLLGWENVDLYATVGLGGGSFYLCPDETSVPRIKVDIDYPEWSDVVAVLLHEATEMALERNRLRYRPSGKLNGDHANYRFVFDHTEFGHVCSQVAMFITPALPKLSEQFKKFHEKKGKKK